MALLGSTVLPSEHVHLIQTVSGHHTEIVHRHYEAHRQHHAGLTVDQGDDHIEWLTSSFTKPRSPQTSSMLPLLSESAPLPALEHTYQPMARAASVLEHGPPWLRASGLRAPPSAIL